MPIKGPEKVVRDFIRQINRRDVEHMTHLMTDRHALVDSLGNRITGRDTMRGAWTGYFGMVPDYKIQVKAIIVRRNTVIAFGTASGSYVPPKASGAIGTWRTPAAWRAIVQRGHIAEWQVYADNEPIRALMRKETS